MDYAEQLQRAGIGGTPRLCQDALAEWLGELFDGKRYKGPAGRRAVHVYRQDVSLPEDNDADADTEDAPPPFVIVRAEEGAIETEDAPQLVQFSLILCAYDNSNARTGWQDVTNMREVIIRALCEHPFFGGAFTVTKPITWIMSQEDTHPYYYGAVTFKVTVPAMTPESTLSEIL